MKKQTILKILVAILVVLLLPSGCDAAFGLYLEYRSNAVSESLAQDRPDSASQLPVLTDAITDVRMTVVPRAYKPMFPFGGENKDRTYLQIYYGYFADGAWTDLPIENYELVGVFNGDDRTGWLASNRDHMVKIGPYLLICVTLPGFPNMECTITDSLGTQYTEPFADYYTTDYGFVSECILPTKNENDPLVIQSEGFWPRYYLILDYESLPNDYVVTVDKETPSYHDHYELTMDQIKSFIE